MLPLLAATITGPVQGFKQNWHEPVRVPKKTYFLPFFIHLSSKWVLRGRVCARSGAVPVRHGGGNLHGRSPWPNLVQMALGVAGWMFWSTLHELLSAPAELLWPGTLSCGQAQA